MENQILDFEEKKNVNENYAGFWIRFGAAIIDGILLVIVQFIVIYTGGSNYLQQSLTVQLINLLIGVAYHVVMESSEHQGTLGKMAVGIKVTDLNGERISAGRAIGRYFSKFVSMIILLIGYMMAGWTDKKQALHDMMAGTLVVAK